ncbi:MAG: nucleotidyltransferase family protein [Magnetococcales bacterium]|nr:nucleotidyltransferase family protein [Magnetococcales bacterium]NGZ28904.1 nucleotidyltransferase family protein [Magnetococcales bacterium]
MKAMILAAGRGTRLAQLTQHTPKPLIQVAGEAVISHTLRRLAGYGFTQVVINAHHLAQQLMDQVGDGQNWGVEITWSLEENLLETGGGVCKALPFLGTEPFLVVNGDIMWDLDLQPLLQAFNSQTMDILLALVVNPPGFRGDFLLQPDGRLSRGQGEVHSFTYGGIQIIQPTILAGEPVEPFSLNRIYDQAITTGRLHGVVLTGHWLDMGTPERLAMAEHIWGNKP